MKRPAPGTLPVVMSFRFSVAIPMLAISKQVPRGRSMAAKMLSNTMLSHPLRLAATVFLVTCNALCAGELSFNRDIRPLLSDACFYCHGPDAAHREADLRLDIEQDAKDYAITPGNVNESVLWERVMSDDPEVQMPPPESGKQLTGAQKARLKRWIEEGAPYEPYWAYVPPKPHPVPFVADSQWPCSTIDHFVLSKMREQGLSPNKPADLRTLIRRVTFDLTGLPPDPDRLDRVLADRSPNAYQKYVDRLLASPSFGERFAIYWLDLVRFADTVGYHGDQDHNISPYRDYVIDAFNQSMPLDQFTREQLAGDLLQQPTTEQLIATGYNRLLQTSHEGGVQPKEYLSIYAADRVRNFSAVWMGATVGCAQCHDHKYDPYTARDFYSLSAFFADIDEEQHFKIGSNALPTNRPPEIIVLPKWDRPRLKRLDEQIASLRNKTKSEQNSNGKTDSGLKQKTERLNELKKLRDELLSRGRKTMVTSQVAPRPTRVLPRGNWLDESGELVSPSVPDFLPPIDVEGTRPTRLDLADWLVEERSGIAGMTARVFVNRLWYLLFGRGLSSSLDDFGGQGQPPTHPELLDRLAIDFVEGGWDIKQLVRRIVLSQSYRQASDIDPDLLSLDPANLWFARQSRYRLPAEMVRDNALSIANLIVHQVGGASVRPTQPEGYYRHLNFPKRVYKPDTDAKLWRRGVYVHWQRQFLHPMLKALDAPSREECTAQRARSNTPLEALVMLNDPTMMRAAKAFAQRLNLTHANPADVIQEAYRIALSRTPSDQELQTLLQFFRDEEGAALGNRHGAGAPEAAHSRAESQEEATFIAWTSVCRVILNLHETVTRH